MPIDDYNISKADYKPGDLPGEITKAVNILEEMGIHSREQFMDRFDVDATSKELEGLKWIGPERADIMVWLRGKSIEQWRELTGLPAFDDPEVEAASIASSQGEPAAQSAPVEAEPPQA